MSLLVENVEVSLAKLAFFIFASAFFKKSMPNVEFAKKNQLIILFDIFARYVKVGQFKKECFSFSITLDE